MPFGEQPRYLFRDNDGIYGHGVALFLESCGIDEVRTAPRSPWQSRYIERSIGTLRRELLNHVIVLSEAHLERLLREFIDECYLSLRKTPSTLESGAPEGAADGRRRQTGLRAGSLSTAGESSRTRRARNRSTLASQVSGILCGPAPLRMAATDLGGGFRVWDCREARGLGARPSNPAKWVLH